MTNPEKDEQLADQQEELTNDAAPSSDEDDVEGHNLLAMSDYYVQSKMGRQADIDRDARQRSLVKEAKTTKPEQRR
jgi:hypothetical protein